MRYLPKSSFCTGKTGWNATIIQKEELTVVGRKYIFFHCYRTPHYVLVLRESSGKKSDKDLALMNLYSNERTNNKVKKMNKKVSYDDRFSVENRTRLCDRV